MWPAFCEISSNTYEDIAFMRFLGHCILIASNFASRSPYWLQIKFFNWLLFYLFTFAINLWHRKFVTADVTAMFVNNQHDMKRRKQDFDKTFIWNQYEERLAILNPKISKFVREQQS